MHLTVCAHYVLLPSVDIKKLTGQKQNQMHQKPFADFSTNLSPNRKENPWNVNPIKGCPSSCLFILLQFYQSDLLSHLLSCPSVRGAAPAAAEHRFTLLPSLQAGPELTGAGIASAGHSWAPLGPRHHHPTSPHLQSLERGRKGRDNLKAPEHTWQTPIPDLHTLQYTGCHLGIHNAEHEKQNLKLSPVFFPLLGHFECYNLSL